MSNWIQKSGMNLSRKGLVSSVLPFEIVTITFDPHYVVALSLVVLSPMM